jgi:Beta-propeller repeat
VFFATSGLTFALDGWALKVDFVSADSAALPVGTGGAGTVNYLTGPAETWLRGIPAHPTLTYHDLWPGIDVSYSGQTGNLKYEFVVAPKADPTRIAMAYRGATAMTLQGSGALEVISPGGTLVDGAPFAYQESPHGRMPVESSYRLVGDRTVGFRLGPYDRTRPLVIDPEVLVYGTFLGGLQEDHVFGVAVDSAGSAHVTGSTRSGLTFPVTPGSFDPDYGGGTDAFVTKLTPDGSGLVYSTFIGGELTDSGGGIAVDDAGSALVTGSTTSPDFPLTPNAFDVETEFDNDAFIVKLSPDGSDLLFGSFMGGRDIDGGFGIAAGPAGAIYLSGWTQSDNFPVTPGAYDTDLAGDDAFVAKIDPAAGSSLAYSTFLGGTLEDLSLDMTVDESGRVYAVGYTYSADFPTTPGAYDTVYAGAGDVFVTKFAPDGSDLVFSTFLGGSNLERGWGIALDGGTNVYLTGYTGSRDFPVTPNAFDSVYGSGEAFVTKLLASGAALDYSSFLGGGGGDAGSGLAVDSRGRATVAGDTFSKDFPVTRGAIQRRHQGDLDGFVSVVRAGGRGLVASTYLGGSDDDIVYAVDVDGRGAAYVGGLTWSADFPTTPGAFDTEWDGGVDDGFVSKLDPVA